MGTDTSLRYTPDRQLRWIAMQKIQMQSDDMYIRIKSEDADGTILWKRALR